MGLSMNLKIRKKIKLDTQINTQKPKIFFGEFLTLAFELSVTINK